MRGGMILFLRRYALHPPVPGKRERRSNHRSPASQYSNSNSVPGIDSQNIPPPPTPGPSDVTGEGGERRRADSPKSRANVREGENSKENVAKCMHSLWRGMETAARFWGTRAQCCDWRNYTCQRCDWRSYTCYRCDWGELYLPRR